MTDLLCIPYAGALSSCYHQFQQYLPEDIKLTTVQLPGRGARTKEKPCTRFQDAVEDIFQQYQDIFQRGDYGLFGHSMGSTMAFELAHLIAERGLPLPKHLFFSGRMTPQQSDLYPNYSELTPEEFQQKMISLGGIPEELLKEPVILNYFMKQIYEDHQLLEDYQYKEGREPFACDISVYYGVDEEIAGYMKEELWQQLTTKECHLYAFSGNHFFMNQHAEELAAMMCKELRK